MAIREKRNGEIEVTQEIPIGLDREDKRPHSVSHPVYHKIKLKISASRESWLSLSSLSTESPERLGDLIYFNFTEPARRLICPGPRFRGINRGREIFVLRMKELIPPTYYWVFWWLKEPSENWPTGLSKLVEEFKSQPPHISGRRNIPSAAEVTAYLFEKDFGKERKKNGLLKWIDDPVRFRRTFVSNSVLAKFFKKQPKEYFLKVPALPHLKAI